ncbi:MAG: hypothetical protein NXI04_26730 [Planctomycetaceae bacterium]|nr:hypothetical protein [Planctomycetaceae bacterium]
MTDRVNDNPFQAPESGDRESVVDAIAFPDLVDCARSLRGVYLSMLVFTAVMALVAVTMAILRDPSRLTFLSLSTLATLTGTTCLLAATGFLWRAGRVPEDVVSAVPARIGAVCLAALIPVVASAYVLSFTISVALATVISVLGGTAFCLFTRSLGRYMQADRLRKQAGRMLIAFLIPVIYPVILFTGDELTVGLSGLAGFIYGLILFSSFGNLVEALRKTIHEGPDL